MFDPLNNYVTFTFKEISNKPQKPDQVMNAVMLVYPTRVEKPKTSEIS